MSNDYGENLLAVFQGEFEENENGDYRTKGNSLLLAPAITASWPINDKEAGIVITKDGKIKATGVSLSAPTFKFYQPKNGSKDTSLKFSFDEGKLKIEIDPDNNLSILHLDIPGAVSVIDSVTAEENGNLTFGGELSMKTPMYDLAEINLNRLGAGNKKDGTFGIIGFEASGKVDMSELLGMETAKVEGEINTFPGEERYRFTMEINVYDMFEAEAEVELKRIQNGMLFPDTLYFFQASEQGIPLVPPVVVAELNGVGGGFSGLADTIKGDFFAIPPMRLSLSAKASVLEIFEGKATTTVGPGYFKVTIAPGSILEQEVIKELSLYGEIAGEIRKYNNVQYKGLKIGGGLLVDIGVPKGENAVIKAGGEVNAFAYVGLDSYSSPSKIYVIVDSQGKLYGKLQTPDKWKVIGGITILGSQFDYVLGGQTVIDVSHLKNISNYKDLTSRLGDVAKSAIRNASLYGGVAYTGWFGMPFRVYYIFHERDVGFEIGDWPWSEFDPFDPRPKNLRMSSKAPLLNEETGKQVGIAVFGDNMMLLTASTALSDAFTVPDAVYGESNGHITVTDAVYGETPTISLTSVVQNDAEDKGVTINAKGDNSYTVEIKESAPDTKYLSFFIRPQDGTAEDLLETLNVKKDGSDISLVRVKINEDGKVVDKNGNFIDEDDNEPIAFVNNNYVLFKLPEKGSYDINSIMNFDIACIYASPYASLYNMKLSGDQLTGNVKDRADGTEYIIRTYLGVEKGGTDYILSQSEVKFDGSIDETLNLSGNVAPTGDYYVTVNLFEKIEDDFNGNGNIDADEFSYVRTDTYEFNNTVHYTNTEQPDKPQDVRLESIGNEVMRAKWKAPAGEDVDGYIITLYQEENGKYVSTGMGYQLEASQLKTGHGGFYSLDMAITVGDKDNHLEADKKYKVGITAFKYLIDSDNDGKNDSSAIESAETLSEAKLLPKATFPVLTYSPSLSGDGMKLIYISGKKDISIYSDVAANIVVTRMDDNSVIGKTDTPAFSLTFSTPDDFVAGALNLKVTATDEEGDTTVDYIGLRLADTPPTISLDNPVFKADYYNGRFTITGHTESGTVVNVDNYVSGAIMDVNEVVADQNGKFAISGNLYPEVGENQSTSIPLIARNAAGLFTATAAQVVRGEKTNNDIPNNSKDDSDRGDRGNSSSTDTSTNTSKITTDKQSNMPTVEKMSITGTAKDGVLSAKVTEQMVKDAIKAAQNAAKQSGKEAEGIAVEFTVTGSGTWDNLSVSLDAGVIDLLKEAGVKYVKIGSSVFDITLDSEAIAEIDKQSTGTVTVSAKVQKKLSHEAKKLIGNRPVFDITVAYQKNGNTQYVTNFGNGTVTLGIPYKPVLGENTNNLYGVYVDKNGRPQLLNNSKYENRRLTFQRNRLSTYGVGYMASAPAFTDTANHWAKDNIDFVASRGLITGISAGTFAPNDFITRADFLMALGKLYGVDVSDYKTSRFTDVKDSDPAMPYIEWAAENQVVKGIGNNMFGPKQKISRQDMAVMMQNYAKATGYELPISLAIVTFSDNEKIADYAKNAVKAIQQAGIMQGKDNNMFDPQGDATRGESSTILRRFIELVIDKGAPRGWSQNTIGGWQYIGESGKPVTGWFREGNVKYYFTSSGSMVAGKWLEIEGKWYYFNDDGSLAVSTKVDGYEVDENGVRKTN
ncbi:S-layer homology domain-containing protein [Lutispora thermophila]|uniref:Putative cell wall binding repeat-containing protein n=1 Tax=Lutispora thermophila DSM 19022 TaxID=1122184 RepID=A0A1M6D201_9FIRM|nr:S-layer homology domain-containing protein [Lutispora thermophila]SHI67018.1 Putative cell wall binding repeat-containing protein [Lutispora thermophila DSM 19022]